MTSDRITHQDVTNLIGSDAGSTNHSLNAVFDRYRNPTPDARPAATDAPATEARTPSAYQLAQSDQTYKTSPNSRPANSNLRPGEHAQPPADAPPQASPTYRSTGDTTSAPAPDLSPVIMAPAQTAEPLAPPGRDSATPATSHDAPRMAVPVSSQHQTGSDAYFYGDRSTMGHLGYTIMAGVDLAAIGAGAYGANNLVNFKYDAHFVDERLTGVRANQDYVTREMRALVNRVHAPEIKTLTEQLSETAEKLGTAKPHTLDKLFAMPHNALELREREALSRLHNLTHGSLTDPANIRAAEEAAATPELKSMVGESAVRVAEAIGDTEAARTSAIGIRNLMVKGGLKAIGYGEAANVAMDYTVFGGTPHTWRTALFDVAAPFVALTPLETRWKLAAIVGTHVINRIWDANDKDAGKI